MPAAASSGGAAQPVASAEGITEYRLSNGLRVLLAPDATLPTTTINVTYLVGSRHENYGESGMAHLLEHLLFKGTPSLPGGAISQEMMRRGMQFNGTTAHDRTNYFETFAASDDNLDWALRMEADRMVNSLIAREALDSEMTVVRNEMERGENSPTSVLLNQMLASAYQWHNYGKAPIGARSDVEGVSIDRLQAFYRRYYQPDNAVLVVAGRFDVAATLARIERYFSAIPKPARTLPAEATVEPAQEGAREVTLHRPGDTQIVAAQYHIAPGAHVDAVAMTLLVGILTDAPSGRLYKSLIEEKRAAGQGGFVRAMKDPGSVVFLAEVGRGQALAPARATLLEQIESLADRPVTQAELDRVRTRMRNGYERMLQDPARYGVALSEAIAKGDWRLLLIARDQIEDITVDDLQRVARHYLRPSNRTLGQFIPSDIPAHASMPAAPDVAGMVAQYRGKPPAAPVPPFDPSPANIETHTRRAVLPNGMELAMLPKPTRGGTVNGVLVLRMGDADSLQGMTAVGGLTASMLMRGTATRNRQQLADVLDALKTTIGVGGDAERVTVSFETRREYLGQVLELVRDIVRTPSFPANELDTLRIATIAGIQSRVGQPEALAPVAIGRHGNPWPKGDPRYSPLLEEAVADYKAVRLEDIQAFHARFYGAGHAQFALVGDFDPDEAQFRIGALLGDWTAPMPFSRVVRAYQPIPPTSLTVVTPPKANAIYIGSLPLDLTTGSPDYARLAIANRVFGASSMKGRIADRLRQQEGISYSASSYLQIGTLDTAGRFGVQALFAPANMERLKRGVAEELARFVRDGITEQELAEAKSGLLQQGMLSRTRDAGLAGTLANQLYLNQTMAFTAELDARIQAATVDEVNAAIRKYLVPEHVVNVYAGSLAPVSAPALPGDVAAGSEARHPDGDGAGSALPR
jgi:zinc protease